MAHESARNGCIIRSFLIRNKILAALICTVLAGSAPAAAQGLTIAAASDLQPVLPAIAARFERQSGAPVGITFGSSGSFFAQIRNGAPFDLFLSADVDYPAQLVAAGAAIGDTLYEYAVGRIVLWSRRDRQLDLRGGLQMLTQFAVRRIAIANPQHAPYGRAAVAALRHQGVYEAVRTKLVLGENVSQTAQFVQSGNADAGLIPLSLALAPGLKEAGTYVEVSTDAYPAIRQAAVVVSRSRQRPLARKFLDFVKTAEVGELLSGAGFGPPAPGQR
jgi:molybdate transport system substrate-binding protein